MPYRLPIAPALGRACGLCQACCFLQGVEELGKPEHRACAHQCPTGCAVYERRPGPCRSYECLWRLGLLGDDDRPDRLGVMLDAYRTDYPDGTTVRGAVAWEVAPGGFERAREKLRVLGSLRSVLVHFFDGAYAWFDGERVEERLVRLDRPQAR